MAENKEAPADATTDASKADDTPEKSPEEKSMECYGGMSFLMLGFAIICVIPGTLCFVIFGLDGSGSTVQIAVATTFGVGVAIFVIGLIMGMVWCCRAKYGACADKNASADKDVEKGPSGSKSKGVGEG